MSNSRYPFICQIASTNSQKIKACIFGERSLQPGNNVPFGLFTLQYKKDLCRTQSKAPARNILGMLRAWRNSFCVLDESGPIT